MNKKTLSGLASDIFKKRSQMKKLKKELTVLETDLKEVLEPNKSKKLDGYVALLSTSERTILQTKKLKEDYPNIYDVYGLTQEVKTLKVMEA